MSTRHTPLPWRAHMTVKAGIRIRGADNTGVCDYVAQADADLICCAVNHYDELLAALEEVCNQYERVRSAEGYPPGQSISIREARVLIAKIQQAKQGGGK